MKKEILLLVFVIFSHFVLAQSIETNFHSPLPIRPAYITKILTLPNGKFMASGELDFYNTQRLKGLVRLNPDGSQDNTFALSVSEDLYVTDFELQNTGDIVALVHLYGATRIPDFSKSSIYVFDADGAFKNKVDGFPYISSITVQSDNKILLCGLHELLRYNSDLTADDNFNSKVSVDARVGDVQQWGNSLIASGMFSTVNGVTKNDLVKLDLDGNVDNSFDTGAGTTDYVGAITIQADGKILLGNTYINSFNGIQGYGTMRLNADGSVDNTFSSFSFNGPVSRIYLNGNDIYAAAFLYYNSGYGDYLFKMSDSGAMDMSFTPVQLSSFGAIDLAWAAGSDGFVISNSQNSGNVFAVSKFDPAGNKVNGFAPELARFGTFLSGSYFNNKLLVAGDFVRVDGFETYGVVSLNIDGTVNQGFALTSNLGSVIQLKTLSDESVLVSTGPSFVKLNSSGAIQPDFTWSHFKTLYNIEKFIVQQDGKIVVADANNLFRLNADGSEDTSFDIGTGISSTISTAFDFDLQSTKVIYGSMFDHFNGVPVNQIVRLDESANVDVTFDIGSGPAMNPGSSYDIPNIAMIKVLDTNEVLVGGYFDSFNGVAVPHKLVKLSADGALDLSFNENQKLGPGMIDEGVYPQDNIVRQIGSRIVIGQRNVNSNALYVINQDGTVDTHFKIPTQVGFLNDLIPYTPVISPGIAQKRGTASAKIMGTTSTNVEVFAMGYFTLSNQGDPASLIKLSVNPNGLADQTINFDALPDKNYGDPNFDLTAIATSGLPVTYTSSNESVAVITGSTVTIVGVGSAVITASQSGDASYNPATAATQTLIVNKANQTITFSGLSAHNIKDEPFPISATSSSGLPVTFTSSNESVATIEGSMVTIMGVGSTVITASQSGDATYNSAAAVTQTLIINKANQTITFSSLSAHNIKDDPFSISATSSSGLPVTFTSSNESVATIEGSMVTIMGVGSTVITASQSGDATYNAASTVTQTLIINKADQSIMFSDVSDHTMGDGPFTLVANSSSGLAVQFTTSSDKVSISGNQVSIVKAGNVTIEAIQPGNDVYNGAQPVDKSFCINPAKPTITNSRDNSNTVQLTSSASFGNQWYLNGESIANATESTYLPTKNGSYSVKVMVDNCASVPSDTFVFSVTAIEATAATILSLYPNPASSVLNVDLSAFSEYSEVEIAIYDSFGKQVERLNAKEITELAVSTYTPGIYLLVASQNGKSLTGKFVKQ